MEEINPKDKTNCVKTNAFSIEKACQSGNLLKNLQEVIESHQDESAKNLGMSIIYLLNADHDKMLECLKFLARVHPGTSLIQRRIAEIHINLNDYETAVTHLEKALKLNKDDLTAKIWLNLIYYETGNEKKAKACLKLLKDDIFLLHASNSTHIQR